MGGKKPYSNILQPNRKKINDLLYLSEEVRN